MKKIEYNAIISGIQEVMRTALIAVIPLVIAQLQADGIDWKAIITAGVIAVLSGVDKWLNKRGVETPLDMKALDEFKK